MLNDRPLIYVSSDLLDPETLTPEHLIHERIQFVPYSLEETDKLNDP